MRSRIRLAGPLPERCSALLPSKKRENLHPPDGSPFDIANRRRFDLRPVKTECSVEVDVPFRTKFWKQSGAQFANRDILAGGFNPQPVGRRGRARRWGRADVERRVIVRDVDGQRKMSRRRIAENAQRSRRHLIRSEYGRNGCTTARAIAGAGAAYAAIVAVFATLSPSAVIASKAMS